MSMIVCITITNAKDYFPEGSTNSDSHAAFHCLKLRKQQPVDTKKLTNKSITQVSRANPDSNRKHDGVVFTICHQRL